MENTLFENDGFEKSSNEITTFEHDVEIFTPLSKDEAEQLTQDIKSTSTALYVLLKRAHDTKAWISLGYKTWTEYIENEFEFSRARSYQLINQANVIEEINEASGVPLYITEREARDIKKRLPEITKRLQTDVKGAGLEGEDAEKKVKQIVSDEDDASNVDRANDFKGRSSKYDGEEDESEDDGYEAKPQTRGHEEDFEKRNHSKKLSAEDEFLFERLTITFKIFETIPDAMTLANIVKKHEMERDEVVDSAKKSILWITQLLNELREG